MSVRGEQNFLGFNGNPKCITKNSLGFNVNPKHRTKPHSLGFNGNPKCFITHLTSEDSQPRGPAQGSVPTQGTSRSFLGSVLTQGESPQPQHAAPGGRAQNGSPRGLHLYPGRIRAVVNSGSHWSKVSTTARP